MNPWGCRPGRLIGVAVPLILDRDPGHDNAIAILFAAANPAVDLLAITTVANRHPPGAGHA